MLYGITFDVCLDPSFPCLLFTRIPRQPSVDESEDTRDAKDVSGDATDEVLDCFVYLKLLSFDSFFLFILLNLCCMYKIIQSRTVTILLATQNSHWGIKMILQMPMMRYVMCFMYSTLLPFVLCFVRFLKLMLHILNILSFFPQFCSFLKLLIYMNTKDLTNNSVESCIVSATQEVDKLDSGLRRSAPTANHSAIDPFALAHDAKFTSLCQVISKVRFYHPEMDNSMTIRTW